MAKTEFFLRTVAKRLDLILVDDKVAVRSKQVIRHQISVVRRGKDLTRKRKQALANFKGEFEMIECVKLINEHKRCISHPAHPEEKQLQMLCSRGGNHVKRNAFLVNKAIQHLVSDIRLCKVEILTADLVQECFKTLYEIVFDDVLIQQRRIRLKPNKFPNVKASKPQHAINKLLQANQIMVFC